MWGRTQPDRGRRTNGLTEVVVVFWLPRVADLLDVDVGGSGWDPHHSVVPWSRRRGRWKSGETEQTTWESETEEEAGERRTMTAAERSHLDVANSFTMPAPARLGDC